MNRTCSYCNRDIPLWKVILSNWRSINCPHCKNRNYTTKSTQKLNKFFLFVGTLIGIIVALSANSIFELLVYLIILFPVLLVISVPFYKLE
ncbi:TIGR04104 family putative zinc finger protein [Alkalicoccobacillus murimartini]|uniref:CXXC-20-CXXC protein n=1 Tax=Alkalicoccobacillus murimartini TaxID=171685 RepID=A0ABT9YCB9_9BACI|nr:CXXC-20-CXXC protein [Alkalicoccobacillus murimartini]